MKAYPSNPGYDCVFNPLFENVYDKQPNTIQPFENSDINLDDIAPIVIHENPPWLNPTPIFNIELSKYKKSEKNPLLIQQHFAEIRSVASEYSAIYTDGSKDGDRVTLAVVFGQHIYSVRLPPASSIFSAEANDILLALLPLLIKVNSWSVWTLFLVCWQLRIVKRKALSFWKVLKLIKALLLLLSMLFSHGFLVIWVSMGTQLSIKKPITHWMIM